MSIWLVLAFGGIPVFEAYCKPEACKPEKLEAGCCAKPIEESSCCGISVGWTSAKPGCCSITGIYLQLLAPAKPVACEQTELFEEASSFSAYELLNTFISANSQVVSTLIHPPPTPDYIRSVTNTYRILRL